MNVLKRAFLLSVCFGLLGLDVHADDREAAMDRPAVPGELELTLRYRQADENGNIQTRVRTARWKASETAIIICDMWNDHYCKMAAQRVGAMVGKMNSTISDARTHGVFIIHAPSGTMDVYAQTPHRRRMQLAPKVEPPFPIDKWCYLDPEKEAEMPVDTSVCPCDDPVVGEAVKVFDRQHPGLDIAGFDGISDSGSEIYNKFQQLGIKNVAIMGVHTNMCVLGRPFGIRQQVNLGMNVVLVRDLTDAMYDPRQPPYVSHARGTELVVEHIERFWCPSIVSDDLRKVVEGTAGPQTTATAAGEKGIQ